MDQEESMIKPPVDPEYKRDSVQLRSSSTPWLNCAGVTMLVLSLVLSVAALWIPWQRFSSLDRDFKQIEVRYEELLGLLNDTRQDILYQAAIMKMDSPDLLKS